MSTTNPTALSGRAKSPSGAQILSAMPRQLMTKLPPLPTSALYFSEQLYLKSLPKPLPEVDLRQSSYDRRVERTWSAYVATPVEAESWLDIYALGLAGTASMARCYGDWCVKHAEIALGKDIVPATAGPGASMVICAPLYVQAHKGIAALQSFIGGAIPHRSWEDFNEDGIVMRTRRTHFWQLLMLPVRMCDAVTRNEILKAILTAFDLSGNFDARRDLEELGRGDIDLYEVIKYLQKTHVTVLVMYGWQEMHDKGNALWKILRRFRDAGISVVLIATAAIALCRGNVHFRAAFPADPIEFGPYDLAGAANLADAYAAILELDKTPRELVEVIGGLYGFRNLVDYAARLIARRIYLENKSPATAMKDVVKEVLSDHGAVLVAIEHQRRHGKLPAELIARFRDYLPLALVQSGVKHVSVT